MLDFGFVSQSVLVLNAYHKSSYKESQIQLLYKGMSWKYE
jgi:hypothetical protein